MSADRAPVVYARDHSPAAIADAFARAKPTHHGPFGPVGQSVVYLPGGPTAAQVRASRTVAPPVQPLAALVRLRAPVLGRRLRGRVSWLVASERLRDVPLTAARLEREALEKKLVELRAERRRLGLRCRLDGVEL